MTATTSQEHFTSAAKTGQEAMSTALRSWGETVQTVLGMGAGRGEVPSPDHLVDVWFDAASEALTAQREFTKALLTVGTPMLDAMGRAARHTADTVQEATQKATDAAQEATRAGRANTARRDG